MFGGLRISQEWVIWNQEDRECLLCSQIVIKSSFTLHMAYWKVVDPLLMNNFFLGHRIGFAIEIIFKESVKLQYAQESSEELARMWCLSRSGVNLCLSNTSLSDTRTTGLSHPEEHCSFIQQDFFFLCNYSAKHGDSMPIILKGLRQGCHGFEDSQGYVSEFWAIV